MAYKKSYKKKKGKGYRGYKGSKYGTKYLSAKQGWMSSQGTQMARGPLFPHVLYAKLSYAHAISSVTIGVGADLNCGFLGNGLQLFGQGGTGIFPAFPGVIPALNDPLYNALDVYARVYNDFTVIDNDLTIKIMGDSVGATGTYTNIQAILTVWCGDSPQTDIVAVNMLSANTLCQQRGAQTRIISSGGGKNYAKFHIKRNSANVLGVKDLFDEEQCQGTLNPTLAIGGGNSLSNPTRYWYYHLRIKNLGDVNNKFSWSCKSKVRMRFHCPAVVDSIFAGINPLSSSSL